MMDKMRARFYETHRILVVNSPTLCAGLLSSPLRYRKLHWSFLHPSRALLYHLIFSLSLNGIPYGD